MAWLLVGCGLISGIAGRPGAGTLDRLPLPTPERAAAYRAAVQKSILELQMFRQSGTVPVRDGAGQHGEATLTNLNPDINAWFLLTLAWGGTDGSTYHLENPAPDTRRVDLTPDGLLLSDGKGSERCGLWSGRPMALEEAQRSGLPYAPLCDARLYLRNKVAGRRTELERVSEFLRDHVWRGEEMVGFVRETLFRDVFAESGRPGRTVAVRDPEGGPPPARVDPAQAGRSVVPEHLGINLVAPASGDLALGHWYAVRDFPGIFLSIMQPGAIAHEVAASHPGRTHPLDEVESRSLDDLVAFDLDRFELGFVLGTEHPRLDWSSRPPEFVRDEALPGPDGFATAAPLVTTGMVGPWQVGRTVAAFTGGFKREHGAFKYGDLAATNHGSHYGFVEEGVVFSKLQPGLATLFVLRDGAVRMKTWTADDDRLLPVIRYARQNGVPLVEPDPATGEPAPGGLVASWGRGNWSGSSEGELRALRAGVCLLETAMTRFLVYGYFSTATPSAMARVFQAYGCRYAIHLDMNALEHTYLALYGRVGDQLEFQHLIPGMFEVDRSFDGEVVPRWIGFPDNRDFFFLTRRDDAR